MKKSSMIIILSLLFFTSCSSIVSIEKYTNYWMGRSIDEKMKDLSEPHKKEIIYRLANGNLAYVESDKPGCFIHWEVNLQGIIVNYELKGNCY